MAAVQTAATRPAGAGLGLRWTIGDVSERGFEALRLSVWGAWHVFGPQAAYAVCVNTVPPTVARKRTGPLPPGVAWHEVGRELPDFLAEVFGPGMAEGVAWKLTPLRLFPERHELSLDNDCILWAMPPSLAHWLALPAGSPRCLLAEDVRRANGQFDALCPAQPLNSGIRGLPPGFDLAAALREALRRQRQRTGERLHFASELDEQGLQGAALSLRNPPEVVRLDEVTVCSPFHPHLPHLGRCGAHFVGLNARHIAWDYYGRAADDWMSDHWHAHRPELYRRTQARGEVGR